MFCHMFIHSFLYLFIHVFIQPLVFYQCILQKDRGGMEPIPAVREGKVHPGQNQFMTGLFLHMLKIFWSTFERKFTPFLFLGTSKHIQTK